MPNITIQAGVATINMTGMQFMQYADNYYRAAQRVGVLDSEVFDPVPYQLYCQALELRLKAFSWFKNMSLTRNTIKRIYGHDISRLSGLRTQTKRAGHVLAEVGPHFRRS